MSLEYGAGKLSLINA